MRPAGQAPTWNSSANAADYRGAYKDKPDDITSFLQQYGNPFRQIGMDADGQAGLAWGLYGVPETYLIDRSGKIMLRHAGPVDKSVMEQLMPSLVPMSRAAEQFGQLNRLICFGLVAGMLMAGAGGVLVRRGA